MGVTAYIRVTKRYVEGKVVNTIDLANLKVEPPRKQGEGVFTAFLVHMEAEAKRLDRVVFVENVLEDRFQEFFRKRGYAETDTIPPCFWKSFS